VPRLAFPVVGNVTYIDDYGAPRWSGWHQGIDIMARRHQPAVAAARGRVDKHFRSHQSTCMLYLHGKDGITYVYIHLNNDLGAKNDNEGGCRNGVAYAPGLRDGDRVRKGELVGYVGDSGDADGIAPHLHFEIRVNGKPINPYKHLRLARTVLFPRPESRAPLSLTLKFGRVLWTQDGQLAIRTRRVVMSNGWKFIYERRLVLAVPTEAVVQRRTSGGRVAARLGDAEAGERVRVWTTSFEPTWRNQRARPLVLSAARILLGGRG
jgi:hypothetical protein